MLRGALGSRLGAAIAALVVSAGGTAVVSVASAPPASAEVCGGYAVDGKQYWANCVDHAQEVRWHDMPTSPFQYACVPAGETMYIGPSWKVWGVFFSSAPC